MLDTELIRLQCYEGLDAATALYEWNYPKQLLHIKLDEGTGHSLRREGSERSSPSSSCSSGRCCRPSGRDDAPPVLLIDEVDRADEEFEAFLLEVLSDFQVTIPEIGTIKADASAHVVLTSNRTRELSDALRRRCLYLWMDYPRLRQGGAHRRARCRASTSAWPARSSRFMADASAGIRLAKVPGVAETLDWAQALASLHADHLDEDVARDPRLRAQGRRRRGQDERQAVGRCPSAAWKGSRAKSSRPGPRRSPSAWNASSRRANGNQSLNMTSVPTGRSGRLLVQPRQVAR